MFWGFLEWIREGAGPHAGSVAVGHDHLAIPLIYGGMEENVGCEAIRGTLLIGLLALFNF